MLEVVEATVAEDEPSAFPAFPRSSLLDQPSLTVWREESEHQVVVVLVGDLKWLLLDVSVDCLEHVACKIFARVNSFVLSNELLLGDLDLDIFVVEGGVQHDNGKGQNVDSVTVGECILVLMAILVCKRRHHPVYLLGFSWESEAP